MFSVMSFGYARSSDKEAQVFGEAISGLARSLRLDRLLFDKLWNVLLAPFQAAGTAARAMFTTVLLPIHFVQQLIARIEYSMSAADKAVHATSSWSMGKFTVVSATICSLGNAIGNSFVKPLVFATSALQGLVSIAREFKSLTEGSMEPTHQAYTALSRTVSTRAWVKLATFSQWLFQVQGWLISLSQLLTGVDPSSTPEH